MLILCFSKGAKRVYDVAGAKHVFVTLADGDHAGTLGCNVTDPAAIEVFLSKANANLFAAGEAPKPIEPPQPPAGADSGKAQKGTKP